MKEGSFEGLMSSLDFKNISTETEVSEIKTPNEIPDVIDFSRVPENVLRSNVIESLIGQNDDLMARLNVSLRRIAILENQLEASQRETEQASAKYDNLKDQVLVLKEQSRIISDRAKNNENRAKKEEADFQKLNDEIKLLEIRYAELYTTATDREAKLREENETLTRKLSRYFKYRNGIRAASRDMRIEVDILRERRKNLEIQVTDLKKNLAETTDYITNQSKGHRDEISELTESYERKIRELNTEIASLREETRKLSARASEVDRLFNDKVQLENDLIIIRRREEEREMQNAAEISDLQKTLARYRNDAKETALENDVLKSDLVIVTNQFQETKKELAATNEQVENLQILWRDQQNQVERLTEQKVALQKLNQELSQTINQYRREVRDLKERLEAKIFDSHSASNSDRGTGLISSTTPNGGSGASTSPNTSSVATSAVDATQAAPTTGVSTREARVNAQAAESIISKIDKVFTDLHGR